MKYLIKSVLAISLVIILLFSCTMGSKKFELSESGSFTLGKTTVDDIRQQFGKPYKEGSMLKNEITMQSLLYVNTTSRDYMFGSAVQPISPWVIPARAIVFYFNDNILVGHKFKSSYKIDATYFDPEKVKEIKTGKTTLNQTVELFGDRYGKCLYPLVKNEDDNGIIYAYSQTENKAFKTQFYSQFLIVSVNKQGVVTDVEFTTSGQM